MPTLNTLDACDPNLNATVSASAGSGKTWLLITRIVRLLLNGAEPGNIIALTFTRKAAGEMQIRLSQRLYEMATVSDTELNKLLVMIGSNTDKETQKTARNLYEKIIHNLYPVRIQTFHSFCQDILSRFPLEADIPPGFELLEDTSLLQRQAWQMLFDEALNSETALSDKLNKELDSIMHFCNGPDNTATALNNFLSHRSDWWAFTSSPSTSSAQTSTTSAVEFACKTLKKHFEIDEDNDPLSDFFTAHLNKELLAFTSLLREINLKLSNKHADTLDRLVSITGNDTDYPLASFTLAEFKLLQSAFIKKDGDIMVQGRQHNASLEKKLGPDNAEKFIELHLLIADKIQLLNEQLLRRLNYKINKSWYYTGNRYIEIFQQLKKEMRLLDFNDLEWKCYELLQFADNAHWVQYKIDQRIDHILVDEFQDTNPTQWHLLSPILEEIAASPDERPRSVFLVGDEKQSIYSFRRANPELQVQASQWLADNLGAKATPLDFSRRSSPAIINCVNEIFMQDDINSIMEGFTQHGTYLDSLPGKVMLCDLFNEDESEKDSEDDSDVQTDADSHEFRNPLQQPLQLTNTTLRHDEAEYIAQQIQQLIDTDEFITEDGIVRRVVYGDIMILMRNRTHLDIYESTLKQYGIPYIGSKKGGLLDNLEIQDLSCLLNTLVTPYNNLMLAQVLKSPIFSASDDDLIKLASEHREHKHWYERLLQLAGSDSNIDKLSRALQRAASLLPRWQLLAEQLPVHDCLDKIYSEGNIINRYSAANKSENKQKVAANCQRFLELSLESDSGRYPSITRFLQKLNHLKTHSQNPPEEPLSLSDESRVTLMTIHGSKGLESPIIFLADCNSTASNKNAYASMVRWPASESRPVNFQLQLNKDSTDKLTQKLQQDKQVEQNREDLNLLYVALTRAREQLYISGIKSRRSSGNSWYQIISNGLQDITEAETTVNNIGGNVYRHLFYENTEIPHEVKTSTDNTDATDSDSDFDNRLLVPVKNLPITSNIIAPSLLTASLQTDDYNHSGVDDAYSLSTSLDAGSANTEVDTINNQTAQFAQWRGNIIHKVLEALCNTPHGVDSRHSLAQIEQQLTAQTLKQQPAYLEELGQYIQEALTTYEHANFKEIFSPPDASDCYNEMSLMYLQKEANNDRKVVYGIVDRLIKTDEGVTIIDYKSHRLSDKESWQDLALKFSEQMNYYRLGVLKLWPELGRDAGNKSTAIKAGILFTQHDEIIWLE